MTPRPHHSERCARAVGTSVGLEGAWRRGRGGRGQLGRGRDCHVRPLPALLEQDSPSFSMFPTHCMTTPLWSPRTPVMRLGIEPKP